MQRYLLLRHSHKGFVINSIFCYSCLIPTTHHYHETQSCWLSETARFYLGSIPGAFWIRSKKAQDISVTTNLLKYLKRVDITPIQYDPDFPYKYNNFVYRVSLPDPLPEKREIGSQQPGTCAVPEGSQHFILRLTNRGAEDMNPETRVENEVAIISLAATALRSFEPHIVPSVYGWGSAASESAQGWILEEMMPGAPVDETFDNAPLEEKKDILNQIATILRALQSFQIPGSVTNFGGLTFGDSGKIVSAAMTTVGSGPWSTYEEYFHDEVKSALQKADKNPYIKGWHANGVRQRLEAFLESGIAAQFKCLENKNDRTIVHGDFSKCRLVACLLYVARFIVSPTRSIEQYVVRSCDQTYNSFTRLRLCMHTPPIL
jgi:hypothetical protein